MTFSLVELLGTLDDSEPVDTSESAPMAEELLPLAHATDVYVHEVGACVVTDAAPMQVKRGVSQPRRRSSVQPNINGLRLHVETVASHPGMCSARAQELVAPWRSISTDHINLAAGIVDRGGQVMQQIEQPWIERMHLSGPMIAKITVELVQGFWYISVAAPINDVEALARMSVIQAQAVFHRRVGGLRSRAERRKHEN